MRLFEIDTPDSAQKKYADRAQTQILAQRLGPIFPDARFKAEKKSVSPVNYVRVLGSDIDTVAEFFKKQGFQTSP